MLLTKFDKLVRLITFVEALVLRTYPKNKVRSSEFVAGKLDGAAMPGRAITR